MLARLGDAWKNTNRNRPGAPLPAIDFEVDGTWQVCDGGAEFIRRFNAAFGSGQACQGERDQQAAVGDAA
jgi:hypothetical protein